MQRAQVDNALATVEARAATLRSRGLDLEHTIIRSPVDGVVISRDVAIGQTVAASLNAPVLFRIAQDLRRMQVELSVDEADIGRIREGQQARFTVDAYPGRNYEGTVRQIRKAPAEVSNVITYTVVVDTGNEDLSLLPGMTANVQVVVGRREDALRVANAALRFRPPGEELAAPRRAGDANPLVAAAAGFGGGAPRPFDARLKELDAALRLTEAQREAIQAVLTESGQKMRGLRRSGAETEHLRRMTRELRAESDRQIEALLDDNQRPVFLRMAAERDVERPRAARLWVQGPDGSPRAVDVMVGISDGNVTEIVRGELAEGDRVIVGMARPGS